MGSSSSVTLMRGAILPGRREFGLVYNSVVSVLRYALEPQHRWHTIRISRCCSTSLSRCELREVEVVACSSCTTMTMMMMMMMMMMMGNESVLPCKPIGVEQHTHCVREATFS
jgi:hypothetical protein